MYDRLMDATARTGFPIAVRCGFGRRGHCAAHVDLRNGPSRFSWAAHELGTREEPGNRGPAIRRYIALAHAGAEGHPGCAIFANGLAQRTNTSSIRSRELSHCSTVKGKSSLIFGGTSVDKVHRFLTECCACFVICSAQGCAHVLRKPLIYGGRDRDRTCDPYHVKVVLFR